MHSGEVNRAAIGVVRKPHGIRGGLKVTLYSIDLDMLQDMGQLFVKTGNTWRPMVLESFQGYDDFAILNFKEIPDRTEAETYRGMEIFAARENLPDLDEDEFYIDDLIGCQVVDEQDKIVGEVTEIMTPGAHEVLVIQKGEEELLIPLVNDWVSHIDISTKQIRVNMPEEEA